MDKDTKVLLMAVVIILVALVSFNMGDLTGKAISKASITVTPSVLNFGKNDVSQIITVKLNLENKVVDQKVYLYREGGHRVGSESFLLCRSSQCGSSDISSMYRYAVTAGLRKGRYYFVTRDRRNNIVAESNKFTVA